MAIGDTYYIQNVDTSGNVIRQKMISLGGTPEVWAMSVAGTVTATNAANGTIGATAPTTATQAGGTDTSGNLRAIGVDTSGYQFVRGANAPAAAIPTTGLMTGLSDGTNYRFLKGDTSGNLFAVGNVASGATDSGNPLKTGGVYNSTPPTFTTGQRGDNQLDTRGNLKVTQYLVDSITTQPYASPSVDGATTSSSVTGSYFSKAIGFGYNATGFDRLRTIQGASGVTTGIGVAAVAQAPAPYAHITTATTTTVKSGAGMLERIIVNSPAASSTITVYDNTAGSGSVIAIPTRAAALLSDEPYSITYFLGFATGLTIVTVGAQDITVVYR